MTHLRRPLLATLASALVACGGGGGGGDDGGGGASVDPPASPLAVAVAAAPTRAQASRFLAQATFGATDAEIERVVSLGYAAWIDAQIALPQSLHQPAVPAYEDPITPKFVGVFPVQSTFWKHAATAPDQLRQRVMFALSVSAGGFDTHAFQTASHPLLLKTVGDALDSFYRATVELGVGSQVTTFTASDFGRALVSNGDGSDHGWGAHHLVIGGGVRSHPRSLPDRRRRRRERRRPGSPPAHDLGRPVRGDPGPLDGRIGRRPARHPAHHRPLRVVRPRVPRMTRRLALAAAVAALVATTAPPAAAGDPPLWMKFLRWTGGDSSETPVETHPMGPHMQMSAPQPERVGDRARADAVLAAARRVLERYRDVADAEADGYLAVGGRGIAGEEIHYTNLWKAGREAKTLDLERPGSLLYRRGPDGRMIAVGVMYTAKREATPGELDARLPLSIATWHRHVHYCGWPAGTPRADFDGPGARFGFAGSIHTEAGCAAAGGHWIPLVFGWMSHVYPHETSPERIWIGEPMLAAQARSEEGPAPTLHPHGR